jgi:hypothetical protein
MEIAAERKKSAFVGLIMAYPPACLAVYPPTLKRKGTSRWVHSQITPA